MNAVLRIGAFLAVVEDEGDGLRCIDHPLEEAQHDGDAALHVGGPATNDALISALGDPTSPIRHRVEVADQDDRRARATRPRHDRIADALGNDSKLAHAVLDGVGESLLVAVLRGGRNEIEADVGNASTEEGSRHPHRARAVPS